MKRANDMPQGGRGNGNGGGRALGEMRLGVSWKAMLLRLTPDIRKD
jgi:hypothetical protein